MNALKNKPTAKMRYCWNCGAELGVCEAKYYDRGDTCGSLECNREARYAAEAEREEAHRQLDEDRGW
jgi:hypothetical protein